MSEKGWRQAPSSARRLPFQLRLPARPSPLAPFIRRVPTLLADKQEHQQSSRVYGGTMEPYHNRDRILAGRRHRPVAKIITVNHIGQAAHSPREHLLTSVTGAP